LIDRFNVNWTNGNGSRRAVFIRSDTTGTAPPADNHTYLPDPVFAQGSQVGSSGWYCVFNGTSHQTGVIVTNLIPNIWYKVMVCEYKGENGSEHYNRSMAASNPATAHAACTSPVASINGPSTLCSGTAIVFYETQTGMSDYNWSITTGGTIISGDGTYKIGVSWNLAGMQTVSISYKDQYGCTMADPAIQNVDVSTIPGIPDTIIGKSLVMQGTTNLVYSVSPVAGATSYHWIYPSGFTAIGGQNTNSITFNVSLSAASGEITVYASNSCGDGSISPVLQVTVQVYVPLNNTLQNITVSSGQTVCYGAIENIIAAGSGTSFIVSGGGYVTMVAGSKISLLPIARVLLNGYLHAYITPNGQYCTPLKMAILSGAEASITLQAGYIPSEAEEPARVYPNPTTGLFTIEFGQDFSWHSTSIEIIDMCGWVIQRNLPDSRTSSWNLTGKSSGIYLIRIVKEKKVILFRLVKI
jgi:hypothetical protein